MKRIELNEKIGNAIINKGEIKKIKEKERVKFKLKKK